MINTNTEFKISNYVGRFFANSRIYKEYSINYYCFMDQGESSQKGLEYFPIMKTTNRLSAILIGVASSDTSLSRNILDEDPENLRENPLEKGILPGPWKDLIMMQDILALNDIESHQIHCSEKHIYDRASILEDIQEMFNNLQLDCSILYLSGHATSDGEFTIVSKKSKQETITFQDIYSIWKNKQSKQSLCLIIMDVCYSGRWIEEVSLIGDYSVAIYSSTSANQQCIELPHGRGGVFTWNLSLMLKKQKTQFIDEFEASEQQNSQFWGLQFKVYKSIGIPLFFPTTEQQILYLSNEIKAYTDETEDSHYYGNIVDGMRNGLGVCQYNDGGIYEGEWKNGSRHGTGVFSFGDGQWAGEKYEGQWKDDQRHGNGIYYLADGTPAMSTWDHDKGQLHLKIDAKKLDSQISQGLKENDGSDLTQQQEFSQNNSPVVDQEIPQEGFGIVKYSNGNIYEGYWKNGVRNGSGKETLPDGSIYTGDWKDDKRDGKGIQVLSDGEFIRDIHEGEYKEDQRHGMGTYIWNNDASIAHRYEGNWQNSKRSGFGVVFYRDGTSFQGEWQEDKRNGKGKYIGNDGYSYEGDYKDNIQHGQAVEVTRRGDKYVGAFVQGKREGLGKICYKSGDTYEGYWLNEQIHGQGIFTTSEGHIYEGEWVANKKEGVFHIKRINGGFFKGTYKNDLKDGQGIDWNITTGTYEGGFSKGKRHGFGIMKYFGNVAGDRYEGNWVNDLRQGKGIYYYSSGAKYEGEFDNNQLHGHGCYTGLEGISYKGMYVQGKREEQGVATFSDGSRYDGEWKKDKKHGRGMYIYGEGNWKDDTYDGEWFEDRRHGKGTYVFSKSGQKFQGIWSQGDRTGSGTLILNNGQTFVGQFNKGERVGLGRIYYQDGTYFEAEWVDDKAGLGYNYQANGTRRFIGNKLEQPQPPIKEKCTMF